MRKSIVLTSLAVAAALAFGATAQDMKGYVAKAPGVAGVARTTTVTATIKKIDPASREVTLAGSKGNETTVVAGPEVKNFAQLKTGDQVEVQYAEALVVELKKGGGAPVVRTEQGGAVGAQAGAKPGGAVGRKVTVVGDVIAIDTATRMITVKGPQRTIELKIDDPQQFKLIAKGDQLEATYMEAVAVDVKPARK